MRCPPPPQFTPLVIASLCLGEALRGSHHHHRHHAVVLTKLSLDPLLHQEFVGHHRAERVLNSKVPYVRYLIGWIAKTFNYINHVNLTLPLAVYEGTWTHSPPLVAMHLLDRSCVIVGIFLKLHATFPKRRRRTLDSKSSVITTFRLEKKSWIYHWFDFLAHFRSRLLYLSHFLHLPCI